jgi:hypothetical protein
MEVVKDAQWSQQDCAEVIQKLRNDLIKDFLDERYLREYFATRYRIEELSNIKIEFIKKELKELLLVPLDVVYYAPMISLLQTSSGGALVEEEDRLFYAEIENILRRHL